MIVFWQEAEMSKHLFKIGDWVTWKEGIDEKLIAGFKAHYGQGPFEIGDVRGETLGIIHHFGAPSSCWHLRHETGFSAGFFKPANPPQQK